MCDRGDENKGEGIGLGTWVGGGGAGDWMHFRALVLKGKNDNNNKARCEERRMLWVNLLFSPRFGRVKTRDFMPFFVFQIFLSCGATAPAKF